MDNAVSTTDPERIFLDFWEEIVAEFVKVVYLENEAKIRLLIYDDIVELI